MKSLKFSFLDLQPCINVTNLKKVWKKKLGAQIRKQIIFDLIEFRDFDYSIDEIVIKVCAEINSAQYVSSRPKHYLVEKSRGLCRQMTLAKPADLLVLQCLSGSLLSDIKANQPTNTAYFEPGDQKFDKNKLILQLDEYGAIASWKRFQKAIFEFSKEKNYVVITDVANFYDFINFRHLRNIVASICDVRESILDFLIYVLNEISWSPDFMPRTEIGMPQLEVEAPRVLPNAMLFELDKVAESHSLGDYVRFMDDIDVGVDSIVAAKRAVRDIDLTLQSRQLRLNSSKTLILDARKGDVADHFCIKENKFLDYCSSYLDGKPLGTKLHSVEKAIFKAYEIWRGNKGISNFEGTRIFRGNGEKIFRRAAKIVHFMGETLNADDLVWLIRNRPSLRRDCFRVRTH